MQVGVVLRPQGPVGVGVVHGRGQGVAQATQVVLHHT
jgi:hypothetical protein